MSVESAVGADPPRVSGGRWNGPYLARHNQCLVDGSLGRLERGGGDGAEVSLGTVHVEGAHRVQVGLVCNVDNEAAAVSLGFAFGF